VKLDTGRCQDTHFVNSLPSAVAELFLLGGVIRSFIMSTSEELQKRIEEIRAEIADVNPSVYDSGPKIAKRHVEIFVAAAQLADLSTLRMEQQTRQLIRLTWALVILTAVLLLFTAFLSYDAYFNHQRNGPAPHHSARQDNGSQFNAPNQPMKPTRPLRENFSEFATTPSRGLSLSR